MVELGRAAVVAAKHFFSLKNRMPSSKELKSMLSGIGIIVIGPGIESVESFLNEKILIAKQEIEKGE